MQELHSAIAKPELRRRKLCKPSARWWETPWALSSSSFGPSIWASSNVSHGPNSAYRAWYSPLIRILCKPYVIPLSKCGPWLVSPQLQACFGPRYEELQTVEAIYCKDIDKFEMVVQATILNSDHLELEAPDTPKAELKQNPL